MRVYAAAEPEREISHKKAQKNTKPFLILFRTFVASSFKLLIEQTANSILEILQRHLHRIAILPVREGQSVNCVGDFAVRDGELSLAQTNDGLIAAAFLNEHDRILT